MKEIKIFVPDSMDSEAVQKELQEQINAKLPITERCKSFEDACRLTGMSLPDGVDKLPRHAVAYIKLCIIARALNEGWEPKFTKDEYRYFPWYVTYWPDELAEMNADERAQLEKRGFCKLPAGVGGASYGSYVGGSVLASNNDVSNTDPNFGGALASRTSEIALFFGKAFHEIWSDYLFAVE